MSDRDNQRDGSEPAARDSAPRMTMADRRQLDARPISAFTDDVTATSTHVRRSTTEPGLGFNGAAPVLTDAAAPRMTMWSQAGASTRRPR